MTLPSILITDTNIWIDLENGDILVDVFHLPYQFFTTDFALGELIEPGWEILQNLGLQTRALEPESVIELAQLSQTHRYLSTVDLAALLLAKAIGATLITGDRHLNEFAKTNNQPVHGVIWILDEMVSHQILTTTRAATALRAMLDHGARLPNAECQARFDHWS
jgi:hypothetical protein